ncbi:MAG: DUF2851 family protein [Candidatus Lambdaproteobacteria bacterium]|nr:DUF2851 family protein [Candidatus Lambdaproteobacteria bacterium]
MTADRQALVSEVVLQRENLLHACWAQQLWTGKGLRTVDGRPLEVLFPGWLNRGPGPDFTDAQLAVDQTEYRGDVELHVDARSWRAHGHERDPAYARVVLHVVARGADGPPPETAAGRPPLVLDVSPFLHPEAGALLREPEELLRRYEELPGRCGLRAALAGQEALERVIAHAAEVRARAKAERLAPLWQQGVADEEILFRLIFQSLGYRPYAEAFRALAERFPLARIQPWLDRPEGESRAAVLGCWLGALGLLPGIADEVAPEAKGEIGTLRASWQALGERPQPTPVRRASSRPWNAPERRVAGLFHHLRRMGRHGLLKGWLALLHDLDRRRDDEAFRKRALRLLDEAFPTPAGEPWRERVSYRLPPQRQGARLIGPDRVTIVMANAVIPFFLAYARRRGDPELEKVLYRLFIVLPPEAPNRRTRFMEQRLMLLAPPPRTLRFQQGLLQIHQDFCTSFHEGCANCRFPALIGEGTAPGQGGG